jgi:hypothetical protein
MLNDNILDIVPHYMYLGLLLTEFLNYNDMAIDSFVMSVIEYGASI